MNPQVLEGLCRGDGKGVPGRRDTGEPASAESASEIAQIWEHAGGKTEFGAEARDGIDPGMRIGPDAQEYGSEIRVDGSGLVAVEESAGFVHKIEILRRRHLKDTEA